MTPTTVQAVVAAAQRLAPTEQLEVIQALTHVLQQRSVHADVADNHPIVLPAPVRHTSPVTDLAHFAANFWPEGESADDIKTSIAQQRAADRMRDLPDGDVCALLVLTPTVYPTCRSRIQGARCPNRTCLATKLLSR